MRKKNIGKVIIALCLALLLFACELNPGGGQNGNSGTNGTNNGTGNQGGNPGGPDGSGGDKKEYPVKLKLVEAGETFFTVEWNALPGENIYDLSMVDDRTSFTGKSGYRGKDTRATVELLVPGETYYISIAKMEPDGKVAYRKSETIAVTTASPSLATPEVTAKASAYDIELSWPAVAGAARYHIYELEYDSWRYYSRSTTKNSFIHYLGHEKGGAQHSYKVIALTADGKKASGFSNVVNGTLKDSTLKNWPVKISVSSYETTFSWDALPAGYILELQELDIPTGLPSTFEVKKAGSTGHSIKRRESGKQYNYCFRLKRPETGDASLTSELYPITVPKPELATAPANLTLVSIKENTLISGYYDAEISWDAVPGAEEYYIYSDAYSSGNFSFKGKTKSLNYKYFFSTTFNPAVQIKVKAIKHTTKEGSDYSAPLTLDIPK